MRPGASFILFWYDATVSRVSSAVHGSVVAAQGVEMTE